MDWQRVLSTNDFHKPRYVGWLPPMHAQNTLRMKRIVLQRGGWNRGSIASDDRIGRHCLLDLPNRLLFDIKILGDAFDDNLAWPQTRVVLRNGEPSQNPSWV